MGEFKFACPVCGQHITADTKASGTQLDCPTCFQKIVVPQGPREGDTKFILAAAQAAKPRPTGLGTSSNLPSPNRAPARASLPTIAVRVVAIGVALAGVWIWRDKISTLVGGSAWRTPAPLEIDTNIPTSIYPIPRNVHWTTDVTNTSIPDGPVVGRISGAGFKYERATLQGGHLALVQGQGTPAQFAVEVTVFAQSPLQLTGRTLVVLPSRAPPLPKVALKWPDQHGTAVTKEFTAGYALKLTFGQPEKGRIPGEIYVSLPDDARSFACGEFEAEVLKP